MTHCDSDLIYDIYNTINERNWRQTNSFSATFWKLFWYLLRIDLKRKLITLSALSLVIVSLLSLLNALHVLCQFSLLLLMGFSTYQIFWDYVQYLSSMFYFINIVCYFIKILFDIIITHKVTYPHWFIIIFFFFMLKKISNTVKCSIFSYFIFSF